MAEDWLSRPHSLAGRRIWVAGHHGMVGAALARCLTAENATLLTANRDEIDLRRQDDTAGWMRKNKPDMVIIAAAKVGGILANDRYPADFIYDNLMIAANIIQAAYECGVEKLLFLGSSCIYPKEAPQPIAESALLSGPLEPTNEAYALAKIAGLRMCAAYRRQHGCDFISAMPCNLYGPGDRFDQETSHVVPALMMRAHIAAQKGEPQLCVWGTGRPRREFLYVEDLAEALVFLMQNYSGDRPVNIGAGNDISIADLAGLIADAVGYKGDIVFDESKPDGTFRKLMDSGRICEAGWQPQTDLKTGLRKTYEWYLAHEGLQHAA